MNTENTPVTASNLDMSFVSAIMIDTLKSIIEFSNTVALDENATRDNIKSFLVKIASDSYDQGSSDQSVESEEDITEAREDGYHEGYNTGYDEGREEGYEAGYEDANLDVEEV